MVVTMDTYDWQIGGPAVNTMGVGAELFDSVSYFRKSLVVMVMLVTMDTYD